MDSYQVDLSDEVYRAIRRLPGNMRQRIVRAVQALRQEPRPHNSRAMDMTTSAVNLAPDMEVRRIRMADWRIVYLIEEQSKLVSVLAVRQRPPYQYDDLARLLKN
jgi:mRNA-degrading endonuclease RelE of RelBE toxin-antitoxin system